MSKPIITICSSANFYRQAVQIKEQLEKADFEVIIPAMAEEMKRTNNYEVSHHKTWHADPGDYYKKAELMHGHFDEVDKADAILVLNFEKNGKANYIGGNVLMEMALAFHARKPIFVLNDLPEDSAYLEELHGMVPVILKGEVDALPAEYKKLRSV
jgi:hypothetical protein